MKTVELVRILKDAGYELVRSNKHLIFSNGTKTIPIPNKREVNKMLSQRIVREITNGK